MRKGHALIVSGDECGVSGTQEPDMCDGDLGYMAIYGSVLKLIWLQVRYR